MSGNLLRIFKFEGQGVRVVEQEGQVWFCVNDVGEVLGLKRASNDARRYLMKEELRAILSSTKGVKADGIKGHRAVRRHMLFVNESGLYTMILRSEKPEAVQFRVWVTDEVLPSIRRTGSFSVSSFPLLTGEAKETQPSPLTMSGNVVTEEVSFTYSYVFSEKTTPERFLQIRGRIEELISAVRN